ncbi:MAG: chaperone modulator CbpM [Polaromonas sp.]|uniref:chaperone modulator CbpM n=1 Tax=Polaromonas sp. TaxID=1869339 RepID=UPI00272F432E|nr:chaperone modulator CbpM [Polaromonas sp.]MDP2255173.1 chaperone modulator CbpM [Polaromonas sp.]MDP3708000.1 chaperone modulator CbpM [Polaromonas sp.]
MTPTLTIAEITGLILEEQTELSLAEICRACSAQSDLIVELVHEGVLTPAGSAPHEWHFTGAHLQRARVALRLQNDLGVNLAGAALALELLDELDTLRARLQRLEAAGH